VSILIVNWNGKVHLETCLLSLSKITYKNTEVVVVDQGSSDGSVEFLKEKYKKVKVVKLKENVGFAQGNNIGLSQTKGEYVLLLNNDTKVEPNFLEPLVQAMQKKAVAVVQPKICFWNKKEIQSAGSFMTTTGFLYHRGYGANIKKYNTKDEIFSANGACMLIKKKVAENLGLFDQEYFAYFEETDFCWRVWVSGYKVIYEPRSVIYHKGGETSKTFANSYVQYLSFRNRLNAILKNISFGCLLIIFPIHICLMVINVIAFLFKGKFTHAYGVIKALFWNIKNLPETLKKRNNIQKARKVGDRALFAACLKNPKLSYYFYLFTGLTKYEKNL